MQAHISELTALANSPIRSSQSELMQTDPPCTYETAGLRLAASRRGAKVAHVVPGLLA